jgi:hypothetical protein
MNYSEWKKNYDKNSSKYTIPGAQLEIEEGEEIQFNCTFPNKVVDVIDRPISWDKKDDNGNTISSGSSIFSFATLATVDAAGKHGNAVVMINTDMKSILDAGDLSGVHGLVAVGKKANTSENIYPRFTFQIDPLLETK